MLYIIAVIFATTLTLSPTSEPSVMHKGKAYTFKNPLERAIDFVMYCGSQYDDLTVRVPARSELTFDVVDADGKEASCIMADYKVRR